MTEPGVTITLTEIWRGQQDQGRKLDRLTSVVESLAKVDTRIEAVEADLAAHDERLDKVEQSHAVAQALVKPRTSGWQVAATIGGLVGSFGSLIALIVLMDKILSAYNG